MNPFLSQILAGALAGAIGAAGASGGDPMTGGAGGLFGALLGLGVAAANKKLTKKK